MSRKECIEGVYQRNGHRFPYKADIFINGPQSVQEAVERVDVDIDHDAISHTGLAYLHTGTNEPDIVEDISRQALVEYNLRAYRAMTA